MSMTISSSADAGFDNGAGVLGFFSFSVPGFLAACAYDILAGAGTEGTISGAADKGSGARAADLGVSSSLIFSFLRVSGSLGGETHTWHPL